MPIINDLQLAKELIQFPSITPVDAGIMKFLERKLKSIGFKTKILEFKDKKSKPVKNIYARLGTQNPNFCYAGHLDVVPPGNIENWSSHPFKPKIKNGKLVGRGASDMKSSVASFVAAVSHFVSKNKKFKGSISLLITGDEEGVAINGTKKVVEYLRRKNEKINFCLVGEPTNPSRMGEMIKIGRRGSITGYLSIFGKMGHVAYSHKAVNPSTCIVDVLKNLKQLRLDNGSKNFQPSNLEITKINIENSADNVIPRDAYATFNIRFNDKHSSNKLKKKINIYLRKICKKHKCKFKIKYMISGESFITKPDKTTYMIKNIIKKNTKINTKLSTSGGTSDARFIKKISPCLEFGMVGASMHQVDENIKVRDLKTLTKIHKEILENYFS
ncbi:succinyl-diaminopimelate desuccinylase [Candidatus Pelagibacter sp.]|nr:succinyl-diaminopimelate desuccinylase [Candidatus Pelagibacter sp.]